MSDSSPGEGEGEVSTSRSSVDEWMLGLSRSNGSPGGGAASGVMLAIAAGLTSMVAGYTDAAADAPERASAAAQTTAPSSADDRQRTLDAMIVRAHELRAAALGLADADAAASREFGSAFTLPRGPERDEAIRRGSVAAARSSAGLGGRAVEAIDDLDWLTANGNPALIADVAVALAALRAAISGARTNVSFDLAELRSSSGSLEQVRLEHPALWSQVEVFDEALARIDALTAGIDSRAAPTDR
ncbi:cyclodeaminase/cyclohydrolase family protein [Subtercola sp. YIM 133946]|uniref:cyclodeaminase/cyclohydrolase family protein n=1 Tax=Subtercola sp. YIM 133946 TaxID=3118909 RepID=UPI002F9464AF